MTVWNYIWYFFTLIPLAVSINSHGRCESFSLLPAAHRVGVVCSEAVDYAFYIPVGGSVLSLNGIATNLLSSNSLTILPPVCQASLKKLVCSNVYLKCPPGIQLSDSTSSHSHWNPHVYSDLQDELLVLLNSSLVSSHIRVPFQRPCRSVCEAVKETCLGLLPLLGDSPNCDATFDYSFGNPNLTSLYSHVSTTPGLSLGFPQQYDASNNDTVCNPMSAPVIVAASRESYLHANNPEGACYGYISHLYVPPGPAISPLLSPMQSPYVVQSVIETALRDSFSQLPVWLSDQCRVAMKTYFCHSSMLAPGEQRLSSVMSRAGITASQIQFLMAVGVDVAGLSVYSFSLPSYPQHQICVRYAQDCAVFIALAGDAALVPVCDRVVEGVQQYPQHNQTIVSLPLQFPDITLSLDFTTTPNHAPIIHQDVLGPQTQCPTGFVVPDTPDDKDILWVPGSGCAFACKNPTYTLAEWSESDRLKAGVSWVSLPLILLFMIGLLTSPKYRKKYLLLAYSACAFLMNLWHAVMSVMPWEERYCRNNAVTRTSEDGVNICSTQSFLSLYSLLGCTVVWTLTSVDIFLRLHYPAMKRKHLMKLYLSLTFLTPLLPCIVLINTGTYGYLAAAPSCFIIDTKEMKDADAKLFYIPLLVLSMITIPIMIINIITIIRNSSSVSISEKKNHKMTICQRLWVMKTYLLFMIGFFIGVMFLLSGRYIIHRDLDDVVKSIEQWTTCVFTLFDGSDSSWMKQCGGYPSGRIDATFLGIMLLSTLDHSIVILAVYGPYLIIERMRGKLSRNSSELLTRNKKSLYEESKCGAAISSSKVAACPRDSVVVAVKRLTTKNSSSKDLITSPPV